MKHPERTKSGLDMPHALTGQFARKRSEQRRECIAMDEYDIFVPIVWKQSLRIFPQAPKATQKPGDNSSNAGNLWPVIKAQWLSADAEVGQHPIHGFPVLTGHDQLRSPATVFEFEYHRRHFDQLGTGT
jgi:hypothetical protein